MEVKLCRLPSAANKRMQPTVIGPTVFVLSLFLRYAIPLHSLQSVGAEFSNPSLEHYIPLTSNLFTGWPHGRIPYLDDYNLLSDPDQAVALNNARMDLQVRTCVKFSARKAEKDYVFFTDLGPQVEYVLSFNLIFN